jgi:hypothetical protein
MITMHCKCVICGHHFDETAPTSEMPMCPKCMGPVTVEGAESWPDGPRS